MTCCILTERVSGACSCGARLEGQCHVISDGGVAVDALCPQCCNVCSPKLPEWQGAAQTIQGETGLLWNN